MTKNYCSECKADITSEEYDYSIEKLGKPLCRKHQKEFIKSENINGLSKKESKYKENVIKGRIAETLIEELFLSLNYNVFRYGMENTVPGIMELLKGVRSDVANDIRRMPDLVVQKGEKVFFIEVKFRADESFTKEDLSQDYPYENCYFVVVSKKHIKCISYKELEKGEVISPTSRNYLGSREEFALDKDTIIDFCGFAIKFFENI